MWARFQMATACPAAGGRCLLALAPAPGERPGGSWTNISCRERERVYVPFVTARLDQVAHHFPRCITARTLVFCGEGTSAGDLLKTLPSFGKSLSPI